MLMLMIFFYIYIYIYIYKFDQGLNNIYKKKSVKFENVERDEREIFVCYIIFNIRNIEN